jgi:ArsR family transcriptional regulator
MTFIVNIDPKLEHEVNLMHNRVCYGIADPKRVLILYAIEKEPLCVTDLAETLGLPQPMISRHLRILRERNLVTTERRGSSVYYSLSDKRVLEAMDLLRGVLAAQLANEQDIAKSM